MMINTSDGPKSPADALKIFKSATAGQGALLGIYNQLVETELGAEATEFVNKNPWKFNAKIKRKAREQTSGRPTGVKHITSEAQALEILRSAGTRATMTIVFRKDRPERVTNVTALQPRLISFYDSNAEMFLVSCVKASGEWQHITRTYIVTIKAVSETEYAELARAFSAAVESVELKHNLADRIAVWIGAAENELLTKRPDVFYDESVFRTACDDFNRRTEADGWVKKIVDPNASMREVIEVLPHMFRTTFLEQYFQCFDAAMAAS
jgi:hypothetical protein